MAHRDSSKDFPPHSKLLIVHSKILTAADFHRCFDQFGNIEDLYVRENHGDPKGVTYIKYSKTSEAALALETMNQQPMGTNQPINIMVATDRDQGALYDEESICRLFVRIPKTLTEAELKQRFHWFGDVESAIIIKDQHTNESRGCGYIKFKRFSDAARAYEECDKSYKAQFAELEREPRHSSDDSFDCGSSFGAMDSGVGSSSNGRIPKTLYPPSDFIDEACNKPIITRSHNTIPSSSSYPHTPATNMVAGDQKTLDHKRIADSVAAELGLDKNQKLSGAQRRKLKKAIKMAEGTWREEKPYKKPLSQDCREEKPYKKPLSQDWREEKPSGVCKYPKEMSHQGVKRPRNDPNPPLNTPKRSRQDEGLAKATIEDASNRMVVIHEQHPMITLDKDQADIILEKLGDILHKDSTSACPLQFLSATFRVGAILMSCANEATVVWLRKAVASLKEDLTIVESKDLSKMPRVSVFIPEPEAENQKEVRIITLLGKQNPDLKVAWWHFLHSEKQEGKGVTMFFCIDEVSFTNLLNNQLRAFYRFGRVVFKVLKGLDGHDQT